MTASVGVSVWSRHLKKNRTKPICTATEPSHRGTTRDRMGTGTSQRLDAVHLLESQTAPWLFRLRSFFGGEVIEAILVGTGGQDNRGDGGDDGVPSDGSRSLYRTQNRSSTLFFFRMPSVLKQMIRHSEESSSLIPQTIFGDTLQQAATGQGVFPELAAAWPSSSTIALHHNQCAL